MKSVNHKGHKDRKPKIAKKKKNLHREDPEMHRDTQRKSNEITIRQTTDPQDFAVCAAMMVRTDPWITLEMDYEQCLKAFDGNFKEIYLIEADKNIAGFVIIQTCGTFSGYIQTICISETFRGKGLGKKLLQFSEERILKFSPNMFICVSSFNKGAARLYYNFGFKLVGELNDFVKKGFSELLLRKTVGPRVGYKG